MAKPLTKGKTAANAIFFVVLVLAGLGVLNLIAIRLFTRLDMTAEKVYTLSKGSKDLVRNLPDRLNVKLFMSDDLKPPFRQTAQFVRDLLDDYATYSGGKLNLEIIKMSDGDAKKGEEGSKKEEEAAKYKVQKSRRGVMSANKVEIGASYLGIGFDYHGTIESIPVIESDQGLEFEISGLIKQMTVKKKKVAFASSEGEPQLQHGGLGLLADQLKKSGYETTSLELKAAIPADVDGLLIIGPKTPMSERGKYVVDQFLMKGKSVAFLVDGETMQTPRGMMMPGMDMPQIAQANDAGVDDLLLHYGFKINADIILDKQNFIGPVTIGQQVLGINHPVFMVVGPLSQDSQITKGIEAMIMPYASSVDLVGDVKDGKSPLKVIKLMASSKDSWKPEGPFVFDPQMNPRKVPDKATHGPFALGYSATGKFKSFFAGKQIVREDGTKVDANISTPGVDPLIAESPEGTRLVVVGDSDFINDQYAGLAMRGLQQYIANLAFTLNLVDFLAQDEALAQVRNKGMQNRPLAQVSEGTASAIKAVNIIGLPFLLCVIGLIRWRVRNSRRSQAHL